MDCFRKVLAFLAAALIAVSASAQEFGQRSYLIGAEGVYGYNNSWKNFGGADIKAFMPIGRFFHMEAGVEALSPKVFSSFATLRPVIPVGRGEIFLDFSLCFRPYAVYSDFDLAAATSIGYRRDYISVQLGIFNHWMGVFGGSENGALANREPNMAMYRVRACVRPFASAWNIGGGFSNFNDFVYERFWQPMFFLDGYWQFTPHLRLNASAYLKPSGIFHQVVSPNEITVRAGLAYTF